MINTGYKIIGVIIFIVMIRLSWSQDKNLNLTSNISYNKALIFSKEPNIIEIRENVLIEHYFEYLDSILFKYDTLTAHKLTEHLLVRANPWIIDTLRNTDYYHMMARDSFVYDQKKMIALPKGNFLEIPDSIQAKKILKSFESTTIDINIPEFKVRIYEGSTQLYEFPIRVGRNEKKYLAMSGRVENLKTKTGKGFVINHIRNPRYVNPVNNHEYVVTRRDDEKVTKLPRIPFIETEIGGFRHGQLIHPTTNPNTLGKAYSNGCIGTKEADAWVIYYYAPINTKINIRYDLELIEEEGDTIVLKDIYKYYKSKT